MASIAKTHVSNRHGDLYPIDPRVQGSGQCCGWLTRGEYNLIDMTIRLESSDIYRVGASLGMTDVSAQSRFHTLRGIGFLTGKYDDFHITPMAMILFNMTDQYILKLDLGCEDAA